MNHERKIPGEWSLARWLLLGISGIALAVAIALAAGNLADQPVGISGEPVSAGSALEPPSDGSNSGAKKSATGGSGSGGTPSAVTASPDTSGTAASGTSSPAPPVAPPAQPVPPGPPVATRGDDSASPAEQPSGPGDSSSGGERESGDD